MCMAHVLVLVHGACARARTQVDHGRMVEFVLNFREAQRGRALPLWCPGLVAAIHKRQFGTVRVRLHIYIYT